MQNSDNLSSLYISLGDSRILRIFPDLNRNLPNKRSGGGAPPPREIFWPPPGGLPPPPPPPENCILSHFFREHLLPRTRTAIFETKKPSKSGEDFFFGKRLFSGQKSGSNLAKTFLWGSRFFPPPLPVQK